MNTSVCCCVGKILTLGCHHLEFTWPHIFLLIVISLEKHATRVGFPLIVGFSKRSDSFPPKAGICFGQIILSFQIYERLEIWKAIKLKALGLGEVACANCQPAKIKKNNWQFAFSITAGDCDCLVVSLLLCLEKSVLLTDVVWGVIFLAKYNHMIKKNADSVICYLGKKISRQLPFMIF